MSTLEELESAVGLARLDPTLKFLTYTMWSVLEFQGVENPAEQIMNDRALGIAERRSHYEELIESEVQRVLGEANSWSLRVLGKPASEWAKWHYTQETKIAPCWRPCRPEKEHFSSIADAEQDYRRRIADPRDDLARMLAARAAA